MVPEIQNQNLSALGKYQLVASLGQGGMARVYLALVAGPQGFNKLLVVKVLSQEMLANAEDSVTQFWDEARLAARLVHPNIVHTYEVGEVQGRHFIAMEYLDGQTYRALQMRTRSARIPLEHELRIISEIARGLHYAHELTGYQNEPLGIVHRDISPQNVFVTYDGQVKLIDFGIAKTHDAAHETRVGIIKGKLDYIAPEQLRGEELDGRADIFSLGAMLWEAVAKKRFSGGPKVADVAKVHARIAGAEAKIRDVKPDVPEALATIIERATAMDPKERFRDAGSMADALDAYLEASELRPTAKSLSAVLKPLFEEDRRAMHNVIDEKIQAFSTGSLSLANTGDIPVLRSQEPNTGSGVWSGVEVSAAGSLPLGGASGGERAIVRGKPGATLRRVGIPATLAVAALAGLSVWLSRPQPTETTESARLSAASPAVLTAGMASASEPQVDAPMAVAPVEDTERAELAPPTPPVGAGIKVELTVTPSHARVMIDGAQVKTPLAAKFRRDGVLHQLEAVAKGYRPHKEFVSFSDDLSRAIALEPLSASRRASSSHASHAERQAAAEQRVEELKAAAPEEPVARPIAPGSDLGATKLRGGLGHIDVADPYATGK